MHYSPGLHQPLSPVYKVQRAHSLFLPEWYRFESHIRTNMLTRFKVAELFWQCKFRFYVHTSIKNFYIELLV